MSDLQYYLLSADADKQPRLRKQYLDAANFGIITCGCGLLRSVMMAYKCLYCGEWFCFQCAEIHFNQTVQDWREQKRITLRKELATMSKEEIEKRIRNRSNVRQARKDPKPTKKTSIWEPVN